MLPLKDLAKPMSDARWPVKEVGCWPDALLALAGLLLACSVHGAMPGLDFALRAFARVQADEAFEFGLEALLARFATLRSEA